MSYETYTPPPDIEPGTRKYWLHKVWQQNPDNEKAVYEANTNCGNPVLDATVKGWISYWCKWHADHDPAT